MKLFFRHALRLPTVAEWKNATAELMTSEGEEIDDKEWGRAKELFSMECLHAGAEGRGKKKKNPQGYKRKRT